MIPNAISIYNEKLPRYVSESKQVEYINNFSNKLDRNISFINPYNYFIENKEEEIFYRADHHWTTKGAYYGYLALCDKMNLKKNEESYYDIELVSNDFKGTLYSRSLFDINKEDEIKVYIPKNEDDEVIESVFKGLKDLSLEIDSLSLKNVEMSTLSMGMSHDYHLAIKHGATIVRVGTAIFGPRNYNN